MQVRLLLICLILLNTACGFHLRGSQTSNFDVTNIYLSTSGANQLETELKSQLTRTGITMAESLQGASYIVTLREERFEKSVLNVSATTGKVEEFQILYRATMDVSHADGRNIASDDQIRIARELSFDGDAVLGKFSEETIIQEDLVRAAATQVLRRLNALLTTNK